MLSHPTLKVMLSPDVDFAVREWRNDPQVNRWCRQHAPISVQEQSQWMDWMSRDPSVKMFTIKDNSGTSVGVCGLTSIDRVHSKAEISLYVAPKYQGIGYETDAAKLLLMHAFDDQNLNRVWADVFLFNPMAEFLYRVGFEYEGLQRQAYFKQGKFVDSELMAITRGRFNANRSDRPSNRDKPTGDNPEHGAGSSEPDDIGDPSIQTIGKRFANHSGHYYSYSGPADNAPADPFSFGPSDSSTGTGTSGGGKA